MKTTKFDIPVVGISHRVSISTRRMMSTHVEESTVECLLVREPENTHDENAVKVLIVNSPYAGFHIGYVPKTVAVHLAPLLDDITTTVAACVVTEWDAVEATATIHVALKTPAKAKKKKSK